ncbi:MAG TPA: dienelactone hydrolase family protein [Terriglobia bacterium]|nr:dienelactone hydrolase family protein [Terriglobia bacterium]
MNVFLQTLLGAGDRCKASRRWFLQAVVWGMVPLAADAWEKDRHEISRRRKRLSRPAPPKACIMAHAIKYPAAGATLSGYLARPAGNGPYPAVLLLPSRSGWDPSLAVRARQQAANGFVALAVDPLARSGGIAAPPSPFAGGAARQVLRGGPSAADLDAALRYLRTRPFVDPARLRMIPAEEPA